MGGNKTKMYDECLKITKEALEAINFKGDIVNVKSFGSGIINDTFLVVCKNNNKEVNNIHEEDWNLKRQDALEKAKYKCEECGNIANLGVYENNVNSSNDELIVLCKKCYEKNINAVKLHYE